MYAFSDQQVDTVSTYANRQNRILEIKTHILYFTEFARQHKLPHSSMLIKIKHPTQLNCWRNGKFQQLNQVSPQNRHPKQSIYVSLSSFDTFGSTLPSPTQN
jgi:hypothetical protein